MVSNIKVNQEITGYDNVYFFDPNSVDALSELMLSHKDDNRCSEDVVEKKIKENLRIYSEALIEIAKNVIGKR